MTQDDDADDHRAAPPTAREWLFVGALLTLALGLSFLHTGN